MRYKVIKEILESLEVKTLDDAFDKCLIGISIETLKAVYDFNKVVFEVMKRNNTDKNRAVDLAMLMIVDIPSVILVDTLLIV